jgi:hypothetical protein
MKKIFLTITVALMLVCQAYPQHQYLKAFDTLSTVSQLPFTAEDLHNFFQDTTEPNGMYKYWARIRNIDWGDTLVTTVYNIKLDTAEVTWDSISQQYFVRYANFVDFDSVVTVIYTPDNYGTPQIDFWADINGDINFRIQALHTDIKYFWQVTVP